MTKAKHAAHPATEASHSQADISTAGAKVTRRRGSAASANPGYTAPPGKPTLARPSNLTAISAVTVTSPRQTKSAMLRARLSEPGGVSVAAMIEATGWQAHTLRAALSGLRKDGLILSRHRAGEDTIYAIEVDRSGAAATSDDSAPSNLSEARAGILPNEVPAT